MKSNYFYIVLVLFLSNMGNCEKSLKMRSRQKRYLLEPVGTQMGLFATISVPLEFEKSTSVAYFFEGNYYTLANATWLRPAMEGPIIAARSRIERDSDESSLWFDKLSRRLAYMVLENNIQKEGLPGRECLLRAICEHSGSPFHHNGVLGDLLYILFTPSSSLDEDLPQVFYEAENTGKVDNCIKYQTKCRVNFLDSFSISSDSLL